MPREEEEEKEKELAEITNENPSPSPSSPPKEDHDLKLFLLVVVTILVLCIGSGIQNYMTNIDKSRILRTEYFGYELNLPFNEEKASKIVTVFAQGFGTAFHQVAKYTGKEGIDLRNITGGPKPRCFSDFEYVNGPEGSVGQIYEDVYFVAPGMTKINHAPLLLYNVHVPSRDLSDLECTGHYDNLSDTYECISTRLGLSCLRDFLIDLVKIPVRFIMIIKDFISSTYFDIQNPMKCHQNTGKVNVAGKSDLSDYVERVEEAVKANEDNDKGLVLFGTSRGAALTFMGVTLLRPEILKRVKLIVLEAPFDDLRTTLKETYPFTFLPFTKLYLDIFTECKIEESSPLKMVSKFPIDIPVAFIMTKKDNTVPNRGTELLRDALILWRKAKGMQRDGTGDNTMVISKPSTFETMVHSLTLENNGHSEMSVGSDTKDVLKYKAFMDDLYTRYL